MFEVIPWPDFESWYEALTESDAELVSSAIDVLGELGPALGPPRSSELLLWFDAVVEQRSLAGFDSLGRFLKTAAMGHPGVRILQNLELQGRARKLWELLGWGRRSLSLFESERFRARVARLEPSAAASVLRGVERVREMLNVLRKDLVLVSGGGQPSFEPIREAIDAVLSNAGLEIVDPALHAPGLRELRIELDQRLARVIYGLDLDEKRVLLISGEPLDRSYYGDAVRAADKRWSEYLASEYLTPLEAR